MSMTQLQFSYSRSGSFTPLPLGAFVGGLTGTARATWPVWRDSTRKEVKFQPLPKKKAVKLYHEARRFERMTRAAAPKGHQDGALGRNGLAVLHALIFDFLDYATGVLFPSIASIAHAANISARSVSRGLEKLKAAAWSIGCAAAPRIGRTGALCCGRRRTPTASCPPRNGAATRRSRSRPRRNPAHGAIIPPCPTRSPLPAKRRRRARPRWFAPWSQTRIIRWRWRWRVGGATLPPRAETQCFIGSPACPCILTGFSF